MTEQELIDKVNLMCFESLSPEVFDQWENVKANLKLVRPKLNDSTNLETI